MNITHLIKLTNTQNYITDDIINNINTTINNLEIDSNNIHIVLKLYSNLIKSYHDSSNDSSNDFPFDLDIITLLNKFSNLSDGSIISFINILCSNKYNQLDKALELIDKYNIHKSSSYNPIFEYLIKTNNYDKLKLFFIKYVEQNKIIINNNREVKEFNYNIQFYNSKIKLIKNKISEIAIINSEINNDIITQYCNNIKIEETSIKSETNIIDISDNIIDIINMVISHNDIDFLLIIMNNLNNPSTKIIDILYEFFSKIHNVKLYSFEDDIDIDISINIIPDEIRLNIMDRISNKIANTNYRNINNQLIHTDKNIIQNKWTEFTQLLESKQFFLIIDGANFGFSNGPNDFNINFIQKTISNIINTHKKNILFIIHQKHISKINKIKFSNNELSFLTFYTTPFNINDDWFWLYASLYNKTFILSNDLSRDHGYMLAYQNELKKWVNTYQIKFAKTSNNIVIPNLKIANTISINNNQLIIFKDNCILIYLI